MKTLTEKKVDVSLRDEWLRTVDALQHQVTMWVADELEWSVSEGDDHQVEEEPLGIYTVTNVNIYTPEGRLVLEPIARNYPGRGIVELYAWPTLYRVRLIRDMTIGGWRVRTDSGISLRQEWNRESFVVLANDLLAADA
ncbi:MAG: hypothetical protein ACRYFS_06155 [Janthinobacterium lividum]